jgi:hypothetical protein
MQNVPNRKLRAIKAVCDYYTLTRAQIQGIVGVRNDRVMRAMLQELCAAGLLQKTRMQVVNPRAGAPAPVYFPTRLRAELVAAEFGDERYLHVTTKRPDWPHLLHWTAVAQCHIDLDAAIRRLNGVRLLGWYGEWDEIDPHAEKPNERYTLYTLIREKPTRLVCAPDAAFALEVGPHSKCYFLEMDRGTSGINQIAHSKTPGYAALAAQALHRRFFDTTAESFTVLHLSPTPGRRDLLRKAVAARDAATLHRFASLTDWTPERALTEAIFFGCNGHEPQPLIRLPQEGTA